MHDAHKPTGAVKSSFDLIDWPRALELMEIQTDEVILDLGCGAGNYSLAMAGALKDSGRVIGLDLWPQGIKELNDKASRLELNNLEARLADAGAALPVERDEVDMFFMATVFHDFVDDGVHENVLSELDRVLKPGGRLVIVEFNKSAVSPGPSVKVKLSPEQVQELVDPLGFGGAEAYSVGPHNYLMNFKR